AHRVVEHRGDEPALDVAERVGEVGGRLILHPDATAVGDRLEHLPTEEARPGRHRELASDGSPEGMVGVAHRSPGLCHTCRAAVHGRPDAWFGQWTVDPSTRAARVGRTSSSGAPTFQSATSSYGVSDAVRIAVCPPRARATSNIWFTGPTTSDVP